VEAVDRAGGRTLVRIHKLEDCIIYQIWPGPDTAANK